MHFSSRFMALPGSSRAVELTNDIRVIGKRIDDTEAAWTVRIYQDLILQPLGYLRTAPNVGESKKGKLLQAGQLF